ncbi:MAG: T9SS type A sorting domain-containing protein [Cyclobacteriaceae bacterium]|nr:T9SS type A sorting domain-containing protein [Cyclobacteriaceae bacterium]
MKYAGIVWFAILAILSLQPIMAKDYFISTTGNDANSGAQINLAWRSIEKVQAYSVNPGFKPGDRILFEGGKTFTTSEGLNINLHQSRGLPENPIIISSYGAGSAVIKANGSHALRFLAQDGTAAGLGFEVKRLIIEGNGVPLPGPSSAIGILVWNYSNNPLNYMLIEDVEVSGFAGDGIYIGRELGKGRMSDITIRRVISHNNMGFNGIRPHSGSGIIVSGTINALIEHCIAYKNGARNDYAGGGPVGIWLWDCLNSTIQFCESFNNETASADGGGFDLDGACQNCIIQYCYSHNNAGAGFLLAQFSGANHYGAFKNNTVRYNISQNDGRKGNYSGIMFWGAGANDVVENNEVYNNTIFMGGRPVNGTPSAVRFLGTNIKGQKIRNNIFITDNNFPIINAPAMDTSRALFQNNVYWQQNGQPIRIIWGNTYNSLTAWKSAVNGQETWNGLTEIGFEIDPGLEFAGGGITLGNTALLNTLSAYTLTSDSKIIDKGLDLSKSPFNIDVGKRDFYGNSLPRGAGFDIGAHETLALFPFIQISENTLDFGTIYTSEISDVKTLLITANHLTTTLRVTMPEGFLVSESTGGSWTNQIQFTPIESNITKTIFVRFKPVEARLYEGNMVLQSEGADIKQVKLTGSGIHLPFLEIQPLALDFGECFVTKNSVAQKYRLTGRWLQNAVTITAPNGYSIATSINGTYRNSLNINPLSGQVNRDIFVRFSPSEAKSYPAFLEHRTRDHEPVYLELNGKGIPLPQISVSTNAIDFQEIAIPENSDPVALQISGIDLIGNIHIELPDHFTASMDEGKNYFSRLEIPVLNKKVDKLILVRFQPLESKIYEGNMVLQSEGADIKQVKLTGSGIHLPFLEIQPLALDFGECFVTKNSVAQKYRLTGRWLQNAVTITAPNGYSIATSINGTYRNSLNINPSSGQVNRDIFVRFSPSEAKSYTGFLEHRTRDHEPVRLELNGKGIPLPQIIVSTNAIDFQVVNIPYYSTSAIVQLSGSNLIGSLHIHMPDHFTVSLHESQNYQSMLEIPVTDERIEVNLFIRFQPIDNLEYTGTMYISTAAIETVTVELKGSGKFERNLYFSTHLLNFDTLSTDDPSSVEMEYIVHTRYLQEKVSISAPDGFRLAFTPGGPYTSDMVYTPEKEFFEKSIFVIFEPGTPGTYTGDLVHRVSGMPDKKLEVRGVLKPEVVTSLSFPLDLSGLRFFPNPASSFLIIEINHPSPQIFRLNLYDINGKMLSNLNSLSPLNRIDLFGIPKGVCILEFSTQDSAMRFKCVIE